MIGDAHIPGLLVTPHRSAPTTGATRPLFTVLPRQAQQQGLPALVTGTDAGTFGPGDGGTGGLDRWSGRRRCHVAGGHERDRDRRWCGDRLRLSDGPAERAPVESADAPGRGGSMNARPTISRVPVPDLCSLWAETPTAPMNIALIGVLYQEQLTGGRNASPDQVLQLVRGA